MAYKGLIARYIAVLVLLGAFASASAAERVFTAEYKGELSGFNIELTRTLTELEPGRYRFESSASNLFASMRETSDFQLAAGRWQPLEYVYERKVFGRKTVERITFDWDRGRAFYARSNRSRDDTEHRLTPGLLDPALYQLALQMDARAAAAPAEMGYVFLKRRGVKHYRFVRNEPTTVELADQKLTAVRYDKEPADDNSTSVWLLPDRDYVLGRLVYRDDDDIHEVRLREYTVDRTAFERFAERASSKTRTDSQPKKLIPAKDD